LNRSHEGDAGSGATGGGLRLSDAEREEVAELLARHSAEGRLSVDELEQRLAALYRARSREEATAVIRDLPPLPSPQPRRPRGRGHAEAETPDVRWIATNERFRDPSTQRIMRVWVDPASGARHYVPDS
jgi:DUF1707 SHOCT-like domain